MATRQRPIDRGRASAVEHLRSLARELHLARVDRGLSLRAVARAMGCSVSKPWRIEHAHSPDATLRSLEEFAAVVGLELGVRAYPGGQPVRDAPQSRVLERFRSRLHASLRWFPEAVFPSAGDQRAWDALVVGAGWRYGVEAETGPRDAQAMARRLELKRRDGQVDGIVLVLPATRSAREFLAGAMPTLRPHFPVDQRHALARLGAGQNPGGSAIVVL